MEGKRVALYLRVSTEEQAKHGLSLDAQLSKLQDYCVFKKWTIFKVFKDEGISAGSTKKRKAFQDMLKEAKEGRFNTIIVTKFDRAFRNVADAVITLDEFRKSNIDFISCGEDIDTTTPMGKAMFYIISVFAQLEREINITRVKDVRSLRFEQGLFPARSPFGYRPIFKEKKIVGFKLDNKESEIVREIFKLTSEGVNYKEICSKLGILPGSYYNIIKNKVYCGFIEFGGNVKKGIHEPIVSEELWNSVNNVNNVNKI